MNRELARGWTAWHTMYAEQKRKMESMRRSMSHMLNRELSRGWGAWSEMALERKRVHAEAAQGPELHGESQAGGRLCDVA